MTAKTILGMPYLAFWGHLGRSVKFADVVALTERNLKDEICFEWLLLASLAYVRTDRGWTGRGKEKGLTLRDVWSRKRTHEKA